jgi:hypothetical protein
MRGPRGPVACRSASPFTGGDVTRALDRALAHGDASDRTAAADKDLRIMVAELAAAKACEMMRGQFRGLRGAKRPGVVTGVFWMKGCRIAQRGTDLTFHLSSDGRQWVVIE